MTIFIEENHRDANGINSKVINKSFEGVSASHRFSRANIEMKTIFKSLN
jgi:hypothetical protein